MIGPIACKLCLADVNICKTEIKDHNDRDTGEGHGGRHRRRAYEGTGRRHEKTQEHMVIQKDIKEDTEGHLGMHRRL